MLNSSENSDGAVRLWVDGQLLTEDTRIAMRTDDITNISGVLADIGYAGSSKKADTIRLSPFELSWR